MAAFQFSVQQVSFSSEDLPLDSSSIDSLSSVVDPNVDFVMETNSGLDEKETKKEWKSSVSARELLTTFESVKSEKATELLDEISDIKPISNISNPIYPAIPLAVAQYINKNNPEICQGAEKYFNPSSFNNSAQSMHPEYQNSTPSSPLHSMSVATEALALQQSVIGNFGVKPVSADIVAQVVANTKLLMEKGSVKCEASSQDTRNSFIAASSSAIESNGKVELIRYPSESISSTVEKRSWFSNSISHEPIGEIPVPKNAAKVSAKENFVNSRSSSQSSINSLQSKRIHKSSDPEMPKVHFKHSVSKHPDSPTNVLDSPYEQYPDSSVEYETESSISEKFEMESLCSETFETESNFSEISGVDDEMFQIRKNRALKTSSNDTGDQNNALYNKDVIFNNVKSLNSSHNVLTFDKATETEGQYNFQLLREKANLEGRLETVSKDQNEIVKERDSYRSLSVSLEVQLKTLQNQLSVAISEKKTALRQLESQSKEHKNWDNVIKEYQNIIETKNSEIKGLKEDLSQSEQAHIRTKIGLEELKVEMDSKEGAVNGLKKKIAELHVEVQVLMQGKIQLENEVKNIRLEMETLQKSKDWFQEQLHITQENRNKLHQELILTQSNLVNTSNDLEKVTAEKTQLRHELVHIQQRAVTEKEVLMKRLETIEADMKERESLFDEIQKDKGTAESALVERIRKIEEEKSLLQNQVFTMSDKEFELESTKSDCKEKEKNILALEKEKAELNKQVAILQKTSNDKDLNIQRLMQDVKDLNIKVNHLNMSLSHSEELINSLKDERTSADVALAAVNEEKRTINETLKAVSENLSKLNFNFKHMKAELVSKTSQAEQLLKEKQVSEETVRKLEENILFLKKEFEQQSHTENQNRDVMFDDLKKSKSDVENVLNVYSKDLLNYQQIVENLAHQKAELSSEITSLKSLIEADRHKIQNLSDENESLRKSLDELEKKKEGLQIKIDESPNSDFINSNENGRKQIELRSKKIFSRKLKEKIKECELLKHELEIIKERNCIKSEDFNNSSLEFQDLTNEKSEKMKTLELEAELELLKNSLEEQNLKHKNCEETILELEKEKGKRMGFEDKYEGVKKHLLELEVLLREKDSQIVQTNCRAQELIRQLEELDSNFKNHVASLESDLNKEKNLVKSLRQQVFQEKRSNSHLKREISSMKSALEQANQISDSKKQDITSLQAELSMKVQAELKHRTEIEHFQTEIRLHQSVVEKMKKELQEVKARDPALAEQIKALSWSLKEKTNEITALKEKQGLMAMRHQAEVDGLKKSLESLEMELESIKIELSKTREEKFNYQSKVIELRKALKSKLTELEAKGILRVENKTSGNGPVLHLNIPDPEVSFDEAYINNLLQKSMQLSESRPLNNLQECLDSLKKEMVELQKKIIDSADLS
ncbi:golgin subfamily A member 3-like [Uloborus diversus]|uniref:golgin subfamily A member 3-like n=1 Tax=Uloborus diversus TaxID=327109 RepID=UPI00240A2297|nr:golgin subfamily A member 3-like [Uloborus diversus]